MRLSVQGCLILLLCLFSLNSYAGAEFGVRSLSGFTSSSADQSCNLYTKSLGSPYDTYEVTKTTSLTEAPSTTGTWGTCQSYSTWHYVSTGNAIYWRWVDSPPECVALSHQPDPITGTVGSTNMDECSCDVGYKPGGGVPGEEPFDCVIDRNQQPEECYENGQIYDAGLGYCVLDCPNGQLNGVCLQDTADNSEDCNADSPDYKGRFGNGNTAFNVCESNTQCEGGSFGAVNGQPTCIPDDYGPPTCPAGGVLVMDEYGFVCDSLQDQPPEEPETPEEPNTDTDDDGQPDEYQKDNDPNINRKQLDELKKSQDDANKSLGKLEQLSKSGNKILKDIEGNTGKSANELKGMGQSLSDIKKNTKDSADNLQDIEDGLTAPSEGYGLGGLLGIPTLSETASQFKSTIMGTSLAQSIDGLTSVPSNTTCPVWTIPKTKFWDAIPMDSHCQAIEAQRGNLGIIFMFFWTGIALFTFWKA